MLSLYQQMLSFDPYRYELYQLLAPLPKMPLRQAYLLLKGACHALEKENYPQASAFCAEARKLGRSTFVDGLLQVDILRRQNHLPEITKLLRNLIEIYQKEDRRVELLKASRLLVRLLPVLENYSDLIAAYKALNKPKQAVDWSSRYLDLLIKQQKWTEAEKIAQEIVPQVPNKIPTYKQLEIIYTHHQTQKLERLWTDLGRAHITNREPEEAEKVYRLAFKRFPSFDNAILLAESLSEQRKTKESVQVYYEASAFALLRGQFENLALSAHRIEEIDPDLTHLDMNQKMHLLTQKHLYLLSQEVDQLKGKRPIEFKEHKVEHKQEHRVALPKIAFGKEAWEKYFGDVGKEPPLPPNIHEILKSPCPYWSGKKVEETHLLVLVPATVNGKMLTLESFRELVKKPKEGNATACTSWYPGGNEKAHAEESYWVLMTRNMLPGSLSKSYAEQLSLLKKPYEAPRLIEAAALLFIRYVQTKERPYSDNPFMFTRCQEQSERGYQMGLGGFAAVGIGVSDCGDVGLGASRKVL